MIFCYFFMLAYLNKRIIRATNEILTRRAAIDGVDVCKVVAENIIEL